MDWRRKHLCDLTGLANAYKDNATLSPRCREMFLAVARLAKSLSSLPYAGDDSKVTAAIVTMCEACRETRLNDCQGREDWRQECALLQDLPRSKPARRGQ